ncbi:hypothetical protein ACWDSL_01560 [Streptomyces sp. NPDC000941]
MNAMCGRLVVGYARRAVDVAADAIERRRPTPLPQAFVHAQMLETAARLGERR